MARNELNFSQRHRQEPRSRSTRPGVASVDAVLTSLSGALDAPTGDEMRLTVERKRLAGRSSIYFVRSPTPIEGQSRWVVKQPHTEWAQDDLDSPVTAQQEFLALTRLHSHFQEIGGHSRVPTPVTFLPDVGALAMEYVPGRTIRQLLNYGSALRPATLLNGLAAAGQFIRHVHALENLPPRTIDLQDEAHQVMAVAAQKLQPLGLSLPDQVQRTLAEFPPLMASSPQVWLHGDFGPGNILLADDGSTVGLDPALHTVGHPEDDVVRFIALMSGSIRFAPEVLARPAARFRRRLETQLLRSYYGSQTYPPLFELRYLHQLARRWCRSRELVQQNERRMLVPMRLQVVGAQMCLLMEESSRRLVQSFAE